MLVVRAIPPSFLYPNPHNVSADQYLRYYFPQEQAYAYLHTDMILRGIPYVWPGLADNPDLEWWENEVMPQFRK